MEIDPRLAARDVSAAGAQVYHCRVLPAVPPGGAYPLGYDEAETLLVDNTIDALRMAIAGHFQANRNRQIWEIRAQTLDFPDSAALDCAHMAINTWVAYEDWLFRLPMQPGYLVRIQITRSHGGAADSPPTLGVYIMINTTNWVDFKANLVFLFLFLRTTLWVVFFFSYIMWFFFPLLRGMSLCFGFFFLDRVWPVFCFISGIF